VIKNIYSEILSTQIFDRATQSGTANYKITINIFKLNNNLITFEKNDLNSPYYLRI